ncbi:MAG: site-specific integrase, partial [Pseudomonadota bacterium]|nr:site-specific integrase [Pseudomonadota bacterium]
MATFVSRKGPNGRRVWQAKIRRRGYPPQSGTFDSKAKAETWARQIESEMDRGAFIPRTDAEGTTLSEMLDRYEHEVTSHKRGKGETSIIKWWRESGLACRPMARIRGKDVADTIKNKEGEGVGPKTIVAHLALLRHLFNIARKEWGMESLGNPVEMVRKPKLPQGRTRRLVDDEESRLLEAARAYGGEIQHLIPWAIETAMRRGEIAAMRWEHLDKKARVLLIPETKTGTPRRVPLSSSALQVLDALPRQIDGSVWSMCADSISQAFERVCKAAGI